MSIFFLPGFSLRPVKLQCSFFFSVSLKYGRNQRRPAQFFCRHWPFRSWSNKQDKAEKNSQVARFANLSEDQLQQIWLLRADPCCRSVIKEFAHAFSCAYIELWIHLGSLESTQKARVAFGCASSYSYAFFLPSKLPRASITRYSHAKHEQILKFDGIST